MKTQILAVGALFTILTLALNHGCAGPSISQSAVDIETETESDGSSTNSATPVPLAASDAETVRIGSIDWYVDYDEALAEAKRTQRPVWLHFGENPG